MKQPENIRSVRSVLVPRPLSRGDAVAVTAPSGPVDPKLLEAGLGFLRDLGLRPVVGCHVRENQGYLAGNDSRRCADLNAMLTTPEIRGVFFARGGYGVMRILDMVDCAAISRDPKLMVGMSDLTALQLSVFRRCGLATFSGPMIAGQVAMGLDRLSEESFRNALFQPVRESDLFSTCRDMLKVLRPGRASGFLLGGCLSMVTALMGTEHMPEMDGCILLLEDVSEPLYRIDRMLTQLRLAGLLKAIRGMVLGHFLGPQDQSIIEGVESLVLELTEDHPVPIVSGFPHGHVLPNITVPHGVPVELDTEALSLTVRADPFGD